MDNESLPYDVSCTAEAANIDSCNIQQSKIVANEGVGKADCGCERGNPINGGTGNKRQTETDYQGTGSNSLVLSRTYNSASMRNSRFGARWSDSFQRLVMFDPNDMNIVAVRHDDGKEIAYTLSGSTYVTNPDILDALTVQKDSSGTVTGWQYRVAADRSLETYDGNGRLISVSYASGQSRTLTYSTASTPSGVATVPGLLLSVTDNFSHVMGFTYDSNRRVATMTDPAGKVYSYAYDSSNNLISVTYPDGKVKTYVYNEPSYTANTALPNALTGIIDESNSRFAIFQYDANGNAVSTEHANGVEKYAFSYTSLGTQSSLVDPLNTTRTYTYQTIQNTVHNTGISQPAGAGSAAASSSFTYDANGNVSQSTDFNGVITTHTYDLTRNLETSRVEASGTPQARTISTSWHATYRSPLKIAEPLLLTTFTYDASGNVLTKTSQATTDTTGASGLSPTTTGTARTWTYTYNTVGQVLTVTGPRTDVLDKTTFVYDVSGNLSTITNAASQVTTLSSYDANGRVGQIVDPNGATTVLTYSPRGWLTSKVVTAGTSTQTTSYGYDPVGQLTLVTLPDSSTITYTYDAAHRLTNIADSLGNSIAYTLDNMGNRLTEKVQDPSAVLARQTTRVMDALNRLQTVTGGVQ